MSKKINDKSLTLTQKKFLLNKCTEVCNKCNLEKNSEYFIDEPDKINFNVKKFKEKLREDLDKIKEKEYLEREYLKHDSNTQPGMCGVCKECEKINNSNLTKEQKINSLTRCKKVCSKCSLEEKEQYFKKYELEKFKNKLDSDIKIHTKKKFFDYFPKKEPTCFQKCDKCHKDIYDKKKLLLIYSSTFKNLKKDIEILVNDMGKINDCISICKKFNWSKYNQMKNDLKKKKDLFVENYQNFNSKIIKSY